ncbi:MAG: cache domain-containing protein [Campylobacterota bacterium]|nr:cache domain-containing protein [Campylobacterota bacterium]
MKNLSIKAKLFIITLSVTILVSILISFQSINTINSISKSNIEKYKNEAYQSKQDELKNYVSLAKHTINNFYERSSEDKIKEEVKSTLQSQSNQLIQILQQVYDANAYTVYERELKKRLMFIVNVSRYGKHGYFWINDFDTKIVMHPLKSHLNGKSKKGVRHWDEFVEKGTSEKGSGFVSYVQTLKGKKLPKVSYVQTFKPYNWIIGTGAYVGNVTNKLKKEALATVKTMKYGKEGYFWIEDISSKIIMHPTNSSLVGQTINSGRSNSSKITYTEEFKPWNWTIKTEISTKDIDIEVANMIKEEKDKINTIIFSLIIEVLVLLVIIIFIVNSVLNSIIISPLKKFEHGILSFFKYLNKESSSIEKLDDSTDDEIGNISKVVNNNINKTKKLIDEEIEFISHSKSILDRVSNGFYNETITYRSSNSALEDFKNTVNNMINITKEHFEDINNILKEYSSLDYRKELNFNNIESGGAFDDLVKSINSLKSVITSTLVENKQTGLTLEHSSKVLLDNVAILDKNSNEAAVSLEETAGALDEITSNISNNTTNVIEMSKYGNEVKVEVSKGQNLANQTTKAMDDIDNEVISISEAITVIDQIAFQTNILSLNAAVEAATAGEAGKGFAVVAQEVRNLASRSADAANDIKTIVETATKKANEGKEIANQMIEGYTHLNHSITKTIDMISNIENSSKEQQNGIIQINNSIASLDTQTQRNAEISSQTKSIALQTDILAKESVESANSKEFEGKNDIKAKVDNNTISNSIKIDKITSSSNNEEWSSF